MSPDMNPIDDIWDYLGRKVRARGNANNVRDLENTLTLSQTSPGFYVSAVQVFGKHCGKGRICLYRAISPFPKVFSTHLENFLQFSSNCILSSANSVSLDQAKLLLFGKGLIQEWNNIPNVVIMSDVT